MDTVSIRARILRLEPLGVTGVVLRLVHCSIAISVISIIVSIVVVAIV